MKITPQFFENNPNWVKVNDSLRPEIISFESNDEHIRQFCPKWDKRLSVTFGVDNLTGGKGAFFHLDNCDCDTIAAFDVTTFEQANQILLVYNIRIDKECELYFDPTWCGDKVIAEFALPIVKSLARKTNAYPPSTTWEEWRRILSDIIFSLDRVACDKLTDDHDWYVERYNKGEKNDDHDPYWQYWADYFNRIENGLRLFGKYFYNLNW